jgi:hypothetical protein
MEAAHLPLRGNYVQASTFADVFDPDTSRGQAGRCPRGEKHEDDGTTDPLMLGCPHAAPSS